MRGNTPEEAARCEMYDPREPEDLLPDGGYSSRPYPDGCTHHTIYDRGQNQRMSWDTDPGGYYTGGGHTVDQNTGEIDVWPNETGSGYHGH